MTEKIRVTLDTNCFNLKPNKSLDKLHLLAQEGKIEIFKTDVVDTEIIANLDITAEKVKLRLGKSQSAAEDVGMLVLGNSRIGHAKIGTDKAIERLEKTSNVPEDCGGAIWGSSRYGHATYGNDSKTYIEQLKKIVFNNFAGLDEKGKKHSLRDCMQLSTHKIYNRDHFITSEKKILNKSKELMELGISVMSSEDLIRLLNEGNQNQGHAH